MGEEYVSHFSKLMFLGLGWQNERFYTCLSVAWSLERAESMDRALERYNLYNYLQYKLHIASIMISTKM